MEQKAINFFARENVNPDDILYILRNDRKTVLHLTDSRTLETYIPVKYLLAALPEHSFLNITKGVVISAAAIYRIEGAVYTMTDGRQFIGRKRGAGEHRLNRHRLKTHFAPEKPLLSQTITQHFSILDHSPLACCVVQLISNAAGDTVDFIFRYCNKALLDLEGFCKEDFVDHSFYDIPKEWNHRWPAVFTDVGLNGTPRIISDHNKQRNCPVTVYCHQPMENYCLCCLITGIVQTTSPD